MDIALIIIIGVLVVALLFVMFRKKPAVTELASTDKFLDSLQQIGALKTQIDNINSSQTNLQNNIQSLQTALVGLQTKIVETTGSVQTSVTRDFQDTKQSIQLLKTELDGRKTLEREIQDSTRRIESVIAGGSSRGQAGESILAEALKQFPPDVIETNFKIKGCVVEYAMILSDGKRVPIDSKWTKPELIQRLAEETDPVKQEALVEQIEKTLKDKVKEVNKYIDPSMTVSWGIAAIPQAAYNVCNRAHLDAFRQNVIIMPYSLAVIYLLSLYHLHRQYCSSVDIAKIESYLSHIEKGLETINRELENSIAKGSKMIANAYTECLRIVGDLRGATAYLHTISPSNEVKALDSGKENISSE